MQLKFVKVRGHAGIKQNMAADQLARQAMMEAKLQSPKHPIHTTAFNNEYPYNYLQNGSSTHAEVYTAFGPSMFAPQF